MMFLVNDEGIKITHRLYLKAILKDCEKDPYFQPYLSLLQSKDQSHFKSENEAINSLKKLIEKQNPNSSICYTMRLAILGFCYELGIGIEKNKE